MSDTDHWGDAVLCPENEDWDWWLKLPPEARGSAVSAFRRANHECSIGVEPLARAMCVAAGNDPDALVFLSTYPLMRLSGHADYHILPTGYPVMSAWCVWQTDAYIALKHINLLPEGKI